MIGADGTPKVSDFLVLELAAARGVSTLVAAESLTAAVNLRFRHPRTYGAVLQRQLPLWVATRVSQLCAELDQVTCARLHAEWCRRQAALPVGRKLTLLKGLIVAADAALAARKVDEARKRRYLSLHTFVDGTVHASARLDLIDGARFDAAANQLADILAAQGCTDSRDVLRARAVGILANPARALSLLQSARLAADRLPTEPAEQFEPKLSLVVHLSANALGGLSSVARIDAANSALANQAIPTAALRDVLAGCRVTVRPLIDLNEEPATDRYEVPARLRRAVTTRHPYDVFPYSTRRSFGLDLDHTVAWRAGRALTRFDNLAPVNRRAHRAKTFGIWSLTRDQTRTGVIWRSPLGYSYAVEPTGTHRLDSPRSAQHAQLGFDGRQHLAGLDAQ